jgi:predicted dehydrogenase
MESWKRKLRMGMVGGGPGAFIGAVHRLCAAMDGQIELVAGCFSQDPAKTKKIGSELYLDPQRCYATYKEMAASEAKLPANQRIDFVSVVTPNNSHYEVAETFLKAGFHVVCDKPVTFTLDEAQKLAKLVEKTKLVFAVTHNYTGHPLIRQARQLFKSGELGKVHKVIVEYLQDFLMVPHEKLGQKQAAWRVDPKQSGIGGTLGDIGTHCVNLLEFVTGDPIVALCADKSSFLPGRKLDEDVNALLRFKNGGKGVLIISQVAAGEENGLRLRVYAEKGAILWKQENPNYMELYRYGRPRETLARGQDYLSEEAKSATRIPSGHPEGYLEAFATIYVGVARAIRRYIDAKPLKTAEYEFPTIYDGVRGMEFIYAAVESYKKGSSWVKM